MIDPDTDCIFCQIVAGESPSYTVWEDDKHIAFLSIFPNTEGVTVVIPKKHHGSYLFDLEDEVITDLILASKQVGKLLDSKLEDVGRTGMIFEGFGVNHIHAKLFPMHGTKQDNWTAINSTVDKYFTHYEGYLSSHDYKRADDDELGATAKRIKG